MAEKKNKKILSRRALFVLVGVLVILSISSFFLYQGMSFDFKEPKTFVKTRSVEKIDKIFSRVEIVKYPLSANVSGAIDPYGNITVGVDSGKSGLNFGRMPLSFDVVKFININNTYTRDVKLKVKVFGNISEFVDATTSEIPLKPGELREIKVTFYAKKIGVYKGELDIAVIIPK